MSMSTLNISSQEEKQYDWTPIMEAIIQVESEGNPKAYNPNGDCVGILQITKILVREVNNILKAKGSDRKYTYNDRWDSEKSKEMFIILQNHFNKEHDIEKAIKWWNLGFYTKNVKNKGNVYYKKVMRKMK